MVQTPTGSSISWVVSDGVCQTMLISMEVLDKSIRSSYYYVKENIKDRKQYIMLEKKLHIVSRQSYICGIRVAC